tara:strand:- start:637 stop:756 length:120 start_codon:yes stop_codon:yes gene_type:complete
MEKDIRQMSMAERFKYLNKKKAEMYNVKKDSKKSESKFN